MYQSEASSLSKKLGYSNNGYWAIGTRFQAYLYFNPAFPFIELFQQILLRQTMEPVLLGIATIWTVLSLFLGIFFFERLRHSFAYVL